MTDLLSGLTQEIISGIALVSIYALIALGFTMIYKATEVVNFAQGELLICLLYTSPSPRDATLSRMPSSA